MAARFWVGGSGTWDNSSTANWSATSGGAAGASAPTTADTVTFDSNSGTAAVVTVAATATSSTVTINKDDITLSLSGSPTFTGTTTLTTGILTLNSYTYTCTIFSSANSNARTINFGTGKIVLTASSGTIWNTATATALVVSGTSLVECITGGAGTRTIGNGGTAGGSNANAISFSITAGADIIAANGFIQNLNFTGFSGSLTNQARTIVGNLTISSSMTLTAGTGATTFAATSGTQQITTNGVTLDFPLTFNGVGGTFQLQDNCTVGSTRTVTLTNGTLDLNSKTLSCGLFSSNNSNTRSIAFGTGNITLTGSATTIVAMATATGFTATGNRVVNATANASTGTRTISLGTVAETSALSINVTAGTDALALSGSMNSVDLTGFAGTIQANSRTVYGNLTIPSGVTSSGGSNATTFAATSGTKTITTNGVTVGFPITFNGVGGTWEFADALTQDSTRAFTIANGTVKLKAGATSTVGAFATSGSNQKYLQSTTAGSQATLSQASGTASASYLTIQDINATGGATWQAFLTNGNVNSGNNAGWDWYYQPGEYMYTRRKLKRLLIQ